MDQIQYSPLLSRIMSWISKLPNEIAVDAVPDYHCAIGSFGGLKREENQDQASVIRINVASTSKSYLLYAVLDGMGGMNEGAECAKLALSTFIEAFVSSNHGSLLSELKYAEQKANNNVYERYKGKGGATLSAIVINHKQEAAMICVGDTRIYGFNNSGCKQISTDDTVAAALNRARSQQNIENNGYDNALDVNGLLQFIGMEGGDFYPEVCPLDIADEKGYIILTDGAYQKTSSVLNNIIVNSCSPEVILKRIITLSGWVGGEDNASGICVWPAQRNVSYQNNASYLKIMLPQGRAIDIQGQISVSQNVVAQHVQSKANTPVKETENPPSSKKSRSQKKKKTQKIRHSKSDQENLPLEIKNID